jgi:hypothetical protein
MSNSTTCCRHASSMGFWAGIAALFALLMAVSDVDARTPDVTGTAASAEFSLDARSS